MKRKIAVKTVIFSLLLLITAGLFCVQLSLCENAEKTLPDAFCMRSSDGIGLSFKDAAKITTPSTVLCRENGVVTSEKFSSAYATVNICKTTSSYGDIMPISILRGSFWTTEDTPLFSRYAVIGQGLATKYFQTDDVIGSEILINSVPYTICGVYRENDSMLSSLAGNGRDMVFIPAVSDENCDALPVQELYMQENAEFTARVNDEIAEQTGKLPNPQHISIYGEMLDMARQWSKVALLFAAVLIFIALIYVAFGQAKYGYRFFKEDKKRSAAIRGGIALGLLTVAFLAVWLAEFEFSLPISVLPNDNIFDIPHYIKQMIGAVQEQNNYSGYDPIWRYSMLLMGQAIAVFIATITMIAITWIYGVYAAMKIKKERG